jgi:hypothetical protein
MVLALRCVLCPDLRTNSDFIQHQLIGFNSRDGVFTARYELIPYIKQITFSLEKVKMIATNGHVGQGSTLEYL